MRLVVHCHRLERSRSWGPQADQPVHVAVDGFIREMRERTFVSRLSPTPSLLAGCPKLRYFFVTAAGRDDTHSATASQRRWIQDRAWRVLEFIGEEGGAASSNLKAAPPMLEELGDYAARRIVEAEGLGLPQEWEVRCSNSSSGHTS